MVKYLKVKDKSLPICLSYTALKNFQEKTGKSLMQQGALDNVFDGDLEPLLFYGLESGYRKEGKECPFKLEDMPDLLDDCLFDFIQLIPQFFPKKPMGTKK